jgi:methylenetetrahydrofolate dehydrogenase (NADP+)/methenyltetrahydrofolate cyclohydrolase
MTYFFDGKAFAEKKKAELEKRVEKLRGKKVVPTLASILVGPNKSSLFYTNLKKKFAESVGCKLIVFEFDSRVTKESILQKIDELNKDKDIDGVMVQLPLPPNFSALGREEVINSIVREKDVDGLREDSIYLTPVVKAVLLVLKEASSYIVRLPLKDSPLKVMVAGSEGFEGRKIFNVLSEMGYEVVGVDRKGRAKLKDILKEAVLVISATGSKGIIKASEISDSAVLIDIGYPFGDIEKEAYSRASFVSPVPGGVGPLTIYFLMENLVESASSRV